MLTKQNALLAAGAAILVALAGDRAASAADGNWVLRESGDLLPGDAVRGGTDTDGSPLYFCRAYLSPGYQPGKVNQNLRSCHYAYGGQELWRPVYEVMVPHWEWTSGGQLTANPLSGEGVDTDGAPLYFCRAFYQGGLQPGKLKQGAGCYIGYGGHEYLLKDYQVLQADLPMTSLILNGDPITEIIAGFEADQTTYLSLCVANYNNSFQPGKFLTADAKCHFSYGGHEVLSNDYNLLHLKTSDAFAFPTPAYDFVVGEDTDGQPLYACRTHIAADNNISIQLGKYQQFFSSCHVSWGGQEWQGDATNYLVD